VTAASYSTVVERLGAVYDAIERGDREEFRRLAGELMHPDGEWRPLITAVEGGAYRGPDGVADFFDDLVGSFDVRYTDREFRAVGENVVLGMEKMCLRGHESEIEQVYEIGVIYEFEGDRVRRAQVYESQDEAIAAAEALGA
jgi:ketosteroid isomerase-like protein